MKTKRQRYILAILLFLLVNGHAALGMQKIPLGGNSYIAVGGGAGAVKDTGFSDWSSKKTVFSTYFRVNQPGDLNLYLEYGADADNNIIKVSCQGKTFTVKLRQPGINRDTIAYIGTIKNCATGYVQVNFQGKKLEGRVFATPTALWAKGKAAEGMSYVDDFSYYWGRRGPSVHLNYTMPEGKTAEWFYNEVTVPKGMDAIGSYFMSNGFGEGYFGMQVNSSAERRVLFSVWSPFHTDDPNEIPEDKKIKLVKKGLGVKTGEFGNEGSGGQSYMVFNWKAGNTYRFLTRIRPADDGHSEYTSYFFAPEVGTWQLIAQFLRPHTTTYYTRPHSFLENFNKEMGHVTRKANYNNQWIYTTNGEWIELSHARFSADNTARHTARMDYKGGVEAAGFFLQNCGFLNDYTVIGSRFQRASQNNHPIINWNELE